MLISINDFLDSNISAVLVPLLSSFGGAFVGSFVTAHYLHEEEHKRLVAEFYSEFATAYSMLPLDPDSAEVLQKMIASIEKLRLFCPPETESAFDLLFNAVMDKDINGTDCNKAYKEIQRSVEKIIRK